MKNKIFLIEDHDQALKVWRKKSLRNLDLVHLDAHIDFGFHPAKPIEKIVNEARTVKELKMNLEYTLAFMDYQKDFNKQTNIGNYIYPAMEDGIVKDFYWVIPGGLKEFRKSQKSIKSMLKGLIGDRRQRAEERKKGIISAELLGRKFIVCTLETLPVLKKRVLLDIDTDFLVIDNLLNADNNAKIGKRKPWILPQNLIEIIKKKIKNPYITTISYSVNGGWTPIKYKRLGDEIAYYLAPEEFRKRFNKNLKTAEYFNLFNSTGKREYYKKAVGLNPTYRVADNNYGPLYLSLRKFSLAKNEFFKVLKADPKNPAPFLGLGDIALEKKNFKKAKRCFTCAYLYSKSNHKLFSNVKEQSLLGLASAEFNLENFNKAKKLLSCHQTLRPLQPQSYHLLGRIFEREKKFPEAATFYKDAIRLGLGSIEPIERLLKISRYLPLKEKGAILKYIIVRYKEFKKGFIRTKKLSLQKGKRLKGLGKIEKKMTAIERRIKDNERDKGFT